MEAKLNRPKVLIVDDDAALVELIEMNLKRQYDVITALEGEEALKIIARDKPDAIILDIMLPFMDGFKVCEKIKSNPKTKDIPVIFLTARGSHPDHVKGKKLGAAAFIEKPFDFEDLFNAIDSAIT